MPDARDLLHEALPHLAGDLQARVRAFLDQPVHIGDTITLNARWPKAEERCESSSDLGFRFVPYVSKHREYDFEAREYTGGIASYEGQHTLYPEVGPARSYSWEALGAGIVAEINGRNYRIHITVAGGSDGWGEGVPDGAVVSFTRTDDPETEYMAHDPEAAVREDLLYRERLICEHREILARIEAGDEGWDDPEYIQTRITEDELHIENLKAGAERHWPKGPVILFGQPCFIQNEITPRTEHEAARHLATLETGWGDSGNINILFACDEDGVPCAAWFEASCA